MRNVKIIGYYLHSGSVLHFSQLSYPICVVWERCPLTKDEMHCVLNVKAEGEEATP